MQVLRKKFPQFAQQHNGVYMQQVSWLVLLILLPSLDTSGIMDVSTGC